MIHNKELDPHLHGDDTLCQIASPPYHWLSHHSASVSLRKLISKGEVAMTTSGIYSL